MTRNRKHFSLKLATAAVALTAVTALGLTAAHADQGPRRIHLIEREVNTDVNDVAPAGHSPGDTLTFHSDMLDLNHKKVGRADLFAIVTEVHGDTGSLTGSGVIHLKDGTITFQSGGFEPEHVLEAITGGTGAYKDAGGELFVRESDGSPDAFIDITLTR